MTRLDDIAALIAHARQDIPALLAVADAASALDSITDEYGRCNVCHTSWDQHASDCAWLVLQAALAPLLAGDTGSSVSSSTESANRSTERPGV